MGRSHSSTRAPRLPLAGVCVVLLVLAVLPPRWIGFVGWFGGVLDLLLAPVQSPAAAAVRWVRGPLRAGGEDDPALAELLRQTEELKTQRLQDWDEIQRLRRQLTTLQRGALVEPMSGSSQMVAEVIGAGADAGSSLLKIKAGSVNGVPADAIAVWDGVHLVGRVVEVEARIARVRPLTDRNAGAIDGVIIPSDPGPLLAPDPTALALETPLRPTGDGRLSGPVEVRTSRPDLPNPEIKQGMIVRLRGQARTGGGENWPPTARMLIIGVVERVETAANERPIVYVRPAFNLADLSEVVLRWPEGVSLGQPASPAGGGR